MQPIERHLEVQLFLLADAAVIGEEVDEGRLVVEGAEDPANILLLLFRRDRHVRRQHRREVRVRAVAQKELEGRGVLEEQRELGWGAALLVLEVDLGTCVKENVDAFDVPLLSSGVEGRVSVDSPAR